MTDEELKARIGFEAGGIVRDFDDTAIIDSCLTINGEIKRWVERKTRNVSFAAYSEAIIDRAKWEALIQMEKLTNVKAMIAYGWSCGTWGVVYPTKCATWTYGEITPSLESVSLNAGVKREVVYIPTSEFKVFVNA